MGIFGMQSFMVEVEADISGTKQGFEIVGLPDTAVSESRERVETAIKNSGQLFPAKGKIIVNLAPADIRKEGSCYDLPVMIAILVTAGALRCDLSDSAFIGELSLSGEVRRINGVLPMVIEAQKNGIKRVFVPEVNAEEAGVVEGISVYPVKSAKQLLSFLLEKEGSEISPVVPVPFSAVPHSTVLDFSEVRGQQNAKKALEVAAAGGHNILMSGPPGSGKSMLAKRLPGILPDMTFAEALETTKIYSVAGELKKGGLVSVRPFRSPHHTISTAGLSGGGAMPKPGELSLAHNGVLFLDEFPEFSATTLEVLRQPMEDSEITISRVAGTLTFPCNIMLVCAMNPCPCGYYGHPVRKCTCTPFAVSRYQNKISGPVYDRIDIQIEVPPVDYLSLSAKAGGEETSAEIKARVDAARKIQTERFRGTSTTCNAKMTARQVQEFCVPDEKGDEMLKRVYEKMGISPRVRDKLLKVARTIADLEGSETITASHIAQAIRYRSLDRTMG